MYDRYHHSITMVVNVDRLKAMEAFVAAADAGSYAAAADRLTISPQMVAKYVQALESRLGVRLLNRTTRRQSLTEFGTRYLDRCKLILAETEAAESMANEALSAPSGKLRISAPINFGAGSFMKFIQLFLERYPKIEISLTLTDRFVDLTDDGYEAAIRIGGLQLESDSLVRRKLKKYQLVACASPTYIAEFGKPDSPEDLAAHNCVSYMFADRTSEECWRFSKDGEPHEAHFKSRLSVNDMRALITAGINNFGIVLGAEDTLADAIAAGLLVPILSDFEGPSMPLSLVYRADRQRTANLKAFVEEAVVFFETLKYG
ncbi:LysR family transcriptional regulator [Pseudomonas prosekii]|uniref:LysR family transcriptional regulator n=1 Tax=Pseudomonas prosekii TaxID=1148509 RepID=UPI003F74F9FB